MSLASLLTQLQERVRELEHRLEDASRRELAALFALGAAHDANNLLAIARLALAAWRDDDASAARADAQLAIDRAAALCRTVRRLARRGAGPTLLDVPTLVARIAPLAERLARQHEVHLDVACGRLPPALVDELDLERVLLNLLGNAIEASPPRAVVRLEVYESRRDGRAYACLSITDCGPGMSPETLARFMQPFHSGRADGHGLGLSVVQLLVHRAGGQLEIDSAPGSGTTARVWIPLAEES